MKAIMLMFDSLNLSMLQPYGCEWTKTPNFQRLAEKSVQFDNCYAGSLPCIPARRELHTGRYNFLHRSWGPLEPWDDSMPEILRKNGVHTHLITDHMHYWEDGGATYHTRYSSWEVVRGQEGDKWKVLPELFDRSTPVQNDDARYFLTTNDLHRHDSVNRKYMNREEKMPMAVTFNNGLEFIENNCEQDNWFLHIECFDPHEPFFTKGEYKELYPHEYRGDTYDWPPYHQVTEDEQTARHLKLEYAALLSMCDRYLGKLLDKMDEKNMWQDTMLILCTDHGYLLGEHGWWSKTVMPPYNEIVHTPLFIYDPRSRVQGQRRKSLVQTIDLPAALLDLFNVPLPEDMQGRPLRGVIEGDEPVRDYALFGFHGGHINITDGRYVYMKSPVNADNEPLYDYTLMPTHMRCRFSVEEVRSAEYHPPFASTKGCSVLQYPRHKKGEVDYSGFINEKNGLPVPNLDNNDLINAFNFGDKLYDLKNDPNQERSLDDIDLEVKMANIMVKAMLESDSPVEQFERIGFPADRLVTAEDILQMRKNAMSMHEPSILADYEWETAAVNAYKALLRFVPYSGREEAARKISERLENEAQKITYGLIMDQIPRLFSEEQHDMVRYFVSLAGRVS